MTEDDLSRAYAEALMEELLLEERSNVPVGCPRCKNCDSITRVMKINSHERKAEPTGKVKCEECSWIGLIDDLVEVEVDGA